jgi:hypothetical protein
MLIVVAIAVIAAIVALLAWPRAEPGPPSPPAAPTDAPPDDAGQDDESIPGRITDDAIEAGLLDDDPDGIDPGLRTALAPGRGRLLIQPVIGSVPISGDANGAAAQWLVLHALPANPGAAEPARVALEWLDERWLGAELPGGAWRIRCARGPGDPADEGTESGWLVDPDDAYPVLAGEVTRARIRLTRSIADPPPGTATVIGVALVDGQPAADYVVRLSPFADTAVGHVLDDGTFRLEDVPVGWRDLELWSRAPRGASPLCYARRSIAPRAGEVVRTELHGRTAEIHGFVVDVEDRPVADARVELTSGILSVVGPSAGLRIRTVRTGPDGRFGFGDLPAGPYRVEAESSAGVAPESDVQAVPTAAPAVRLVLQPFVTVRGELVVEGWRESSRRRSRGLGLVLRGPVERFVRCRPGEVEFGRLLPGRYRVVETFSRGRYRADEDLVVPPGGLESARIVLRARR